MTNRFLVIRHLLRVVAVVRSDREDAIPRVLDAFPFISEALLDNLYEVAGTIGTISTTLAVLVGRVIVSELLDRSEDKLDAGLFAEHKLRPPRFWFLVVITYRKPVASNLVCKGSAPLARHLHTEDHLHNFFEVLLIAGDTKLLVTVKHLLFSFLSVCSSALTAVIGLAVIASPP